MKQLLIFSGWYFEFTCVNSSVQRVERLFLGLKLDVLKCFEDFSLKCSYFFRIEYIIRLLTQANPVESREIYCHFCSDFSANFNNVCLILTDFV